jgi:hypothetical protein
MRLKTKNKLRRVIANSKCKFLSSLMSGFDWNKSRFVTRKKDGKLYSILIGNKNMNFAIKSTIDSSTKNHANKLRILSRNNTKHVANYGGSVNNIVLI